MHKINNIAWKYFILFSLLIILTLWLFLSLFFNKYYYYIKKINATNIANDIIKYQNDKDFKQKIDTLSYHNRICVEVVDKSFNTIYASNNFGMECRYYRHEKTNQFMNTLINSDKDNQKIVSNKKNNNEFLIISKKLKNNKYAFITTPLNPNKSTTSIIRNQLIYISLFIIILSFVISYFISRHLSKPLIEINNQSKSGLKNDIKIDTDILEINELVDTLNYTRKELIKTQDLRRDFISNVSHDMKTPLTMIRAYADMINDLHKDDYEKRVEDSKIIIEEVNRLDAFISDVLDLSKMQSNVYVLKIERFNIISLIENIINRFNGLVANENIIFEFNHDSKRIMVSADKSKIEQVLYNLISNAINYVGKDKKVIIDVNNNEDDVLIKITDHGSGISEEELPNIWSKYYRIDKNFHRKKIGNGIGLAIVKRILVTHDFQYGVNSIVNEGSTFWFKIKK